jgi:DNA-binding transcriptional LysR family regulator
VRQALRQAQLALTGGQDFDLATEERTFRIAMSPEIELLLIPELTARLRRRAPGLKVLARVFPYEAMEPSLEDGSIDLAVGCTYSKTSRRSFETLYEPEVACCYNPALLALSKPVSLAAYLSAEHATISQNETLQGCIKDALEIAGVELNVVTAAPGYMSVLSAAQASPVIATVPSRIADRYAALLGLEISPLPISLTFPPVNMVWAIHAEGDPANSWLRQQIRDSLAMASAKPCVRAA